eukprot:TRINITY_DN49139_c0_g1_i1.p1 TRINITY_DN49139_c0_g1~~TRINITY_DN49139_c0_g1_i1.p1  ORF type:complete len:249 (+),score=16.87 TRINITY_DN49139_c0_g1_i1:55-801(+)
MKPRRPKHHRSWSDSIRLAVVLLMVIMVVYVTYTLTQFRPGVDDHHPTQPQQRRVASDVLKIPPIQPDDAVHTFVVNATAEGATPTYPTMCQAHQGYTLIPRVRHVVVIPGNAIPPKAKSTHELWKEKEPDWEHTIHTDADCLELADKFAALRGGDGDDEVRFLPPSHRSRAKKHYVYNFSQVYRDYQLSVMRVDVCRMLVLYFHGGLFMDLDVLHRRLISSWDVSWQSIDIMPVSYTHLTLPTKRIV